MKIALIGATGRMGQAIARAALAEGDSIAGAAASTSSSSLGRDLGELAGLGTIGVAVDADVSASLLGADVAIDFSKPEVLVAAARAASRAKIPLVCGTTGIGPEHERALDDAATAIPVLWAPNTSVGVEVLAELVRLAVQKLGAGFDIEIVEAHHRNKADAPSGTAKRLVRAAAEAREGLVSVHGREGKPGARKPDEIGVLALRGGDVIGDHTVHLLGAGERIELTHRATSRELFARGALRAARFLIGKPAGRYTMADVIASR